MKKTEMMKKFEVETGKQSAIVKFMAGGQALEPKSYPKLGPYDYSTDYIAWLEAKATAYDRVMSGGKKTLKEWANVLNMIVTLNFDGNLEIWEKVPTFQAGPWCGDGYVGVLASDCWDYTGDWKDSLTLPDGWEATDD